jgi:hypothetical protein
MNLHNLAYMLAKEYGYTYHRTSAFRGLTYSERIEISRLITFILEQEN